jgi:hypothetical protein
MATKDSRAIDVHFPKCSKPVRVTFSKHADTFDPSTPKAVLRHFRRPPPFSTGKEPPLWVLRINGKDSTVFAVTADGIYTKGARGKDRVYQWREVLKIHVY